LQAGLAFLPATVLNFAVALAVPRLTRQFNMAWVLSGGLAISMLGMAWLSRAGPETSYLLGVALPMVLIGAGQGATLGPLTIAGVAGVAQDDAGAGSGLVNVAHQIGGTLGLGLLVVVAAAARGFATDPRVDLAHQISIALSASALLLAAALVVALRLIVRRPSTRIPSNICKCAGS
jgi:sugar phosphate permease